MICFISRPFLFIIFLSIVMFWFGFISFHVNSFHLMSFNFTSCHLMSFHLISRNSSPRLTLVLASAFVWVSGEATIITERPCFVLVVTCAQAGAIDVGEGRVVAWQLAPGNGNCPEAISAAPPVLRDSTARRCQARRVPEPKFRCRPSCRRSWFKVNIQRLPRNPASLLTQIPM